MNPELTHLQTPRGNSAAFWCRPDTSDSPAVHSILLADEYGMTAATGWAIDIGSHIGSWAIGMALDNPGLKVVAVEPVPENAELLRRNIEQNGLTGRVFAVEVAAGRAGEQTTLKYGYRSVAGEPDNYVSDHRFIAGTWGIDTGDPEFSLTLTAVSLGELMERFEMDRVTVLKIDCEGCEWSFLDSPALALVGRIVGEAHGGHVDIDIASLLGRTHTVVMSATDATNLTFNAWPA